MSIESTSRRLQSVPEKQQKLLHPKTNLERGRHRQSQLHDFDVLVQSGQWSETPEGNQNFMRLVQLNVGLYEATRSRTERSYITQSIVRSIRHEGGRFLQYVSEWPRHASPTTDENPTNGGDDCIWILKEMTDEQAETFTGKALEEAIQNRQQQQEQQEQQEQQQQEQQQRSQDTARVNFNDHDPQHLLYPRQKMVQSSTTSISHRKPFRVLQPQNLTQSLEPEKQKIFQESRFVESEYGSGFDVRQDKHDDNDARTLADDSIHSFENQENNPMLVGENATSTTTTFPPSPPSPPVALVMMHTKAPWTVSPIRNQRKRIRVDAFGDSPPPSPSTIPHIPPMKRRRRWNYNDE